MADYISRRALTNALTSWQMDYAEKDKDVERFEILGAVIDLVEQMPTIEPKKGKWIYHEPLDVFECSVCGRQMVRNIFNYCPWCGAKMERSEE